MCCQVLRGACACTLAWCANVTNVIADTTRLHPRGIHPRTRPCTRTRRGGLGGFFHIRRGTNECGIETTPAAGLPDLAALFDQTDLP